MEYLVSRYLEASKCRAIMMRNVKRAAMQRNKKQGSLALLALPHQRGAGW